MSEKFREAHLRAWKRQEERQWIFGTLGKKKNDGGYTFDVPGRSDFVYVTMRNAANGAQTTVPARNDAGVPQGPKLAVRMKLEYGVYVIHGRSGDQNSGTTNLPIPASGVPSHSHTDGTEQTTLENVNRFAITDNNVAKYATWLTIKDTITTLGDTLWGRLAGNNIWTGTNQHNVTTTTGAALGVTRDLAAASTDAPLVNLIQDNVGDDQIALRVQQDGTGKIIALFDGATEVLTGEDGGQFGFGVTAPAATVHVSQVQTTGEALRVIRDLASASTDSPLVNLIQDNVGDDQVALRVQQDGTGDLVNYFDGATKVMALLDGGRMDIAQIIRALTSSGLQLQDDGGNIFMTFEDGGQIGVGLTATVPTALLHLIQTQTTGEALKVVRDLGSASTDSPLVSLVQDNVGDDQVALRIQQDGTGDLVNYFDGGTLVFSIVDGGIAKFEKAVNFSEGTQDYQILSDGGTNMVIQSLTAGASGAVRFNTFDSDNSDNFNLEIWGKGKTSDLGNRERLIIGYAAAASFLIQTDFAGTGVARPIIIFTSGNSNQLYLDTDGQVGFGTSSPAATAHISQTQTTGEALRVIRDLGSASTDSPLANLIQDNSGDDQIVLRVQQDGTGKIVSVFDGATEVFSVEDGGIVNMNAGFLAVKAGASIVERTTAATNTLNGALVLKSTSSGVMADGFGSGFLFQARDTDAVDNTLSTIGAVRDGADNSGAFVIYTSLAGVQNERVRVTKDGYVGIGGTPTVPLYVAADAIFLATFETTGSTKNAVVSFKAPTGKNTNFAFYEGATLKKELRYDATANGFGIVQTDEATFDIFVDDATGKVIVGGLTSAGANVLGIVAGSSTNDASVGGVLYVDNSAHSNVTTGETDLATYVGNVPANTLAVTGQELVVEASGAFTNSASVKTLRLYFGADVWTIATSNLSLANWTIRARIMRTGAATQNVLIEYLASINIDIRITRSTATRTLSSAQVLKLTGQGGASNEITQENFKVSWRDTNT